MIKLGITNECLVKNLKDAGDIEGNPALQEACELGRAL
ncbi:hypothetical protein SAMN05216529_102263 [Faecalicatena contorta]|uniref:Uncharacterized protein n=1 Tax=Faecalicatena contorta TaxID=39482 RepID=A0A316A3H3_9FIRM|nr:hypothetical protein A8805_102263 [Faecalicatena contorta]SUQ13046.1 hypothetical protein SAMN05216529_102263 [Faecalicatena contorta]